jgi:hypothetical protein
MPTELEKLEARIAEMEAWLFKTHQSGRPSAVSRIDRLEISQKQMGNGSRIDRLEIAQKQMSKRWNLIGGAIVTVVTIVLAGVVVSLLTRG